MKQKTKKQKLRAAMRRARRLTFTVFFGNCNRVETSLAASARKSQWRKMLKRKYRTMYAFFEEGCAPDRAVLPPARFRNNA